ncbi:MAG TPA: hypothetical protein VK513_07470 [Terriglobales bacterium]|nr:hypothetical protein [Terriglobales bacterium]
MRASPPAVVSLVPMKDPAHADQGLGKAWVVLIVLLIFCGNLPAEAQDMPRVQVFGGYSYTRFDSPSFGFSSPSGLHGYNFSPAFNLLYGFGVVAELSGQYGSKLNFRDIAVGPQFLYPKGKGMFFAHLLVGDARTLVRVANTEGDTARAVVLGGGMDLDISSHFGLRVFQVDYMHTTLFKDPQNNLRFSTGLVYRWGRIRQKGHRAPVQNP